MCVFMFTFLSPCHCSGGTVGHLRGCFLSRGTPSTLSENEKNEEETKKGHVSVIVRMS